MNIRIAIAVIGFFTVMIGPWWIPLICMILLCIRWSAPEAVALGLLMDFVWHGSTFTTSWHTWPIFTLIGIALLWGFEPLRRRFLF